MEDQEAAFLASMQSMGEVAGNHDGANGASSSQQAETYSSDEYDPAQAEPAVHSVLSPSNAPSSATLKDSSADALPSDSLHPSTTAPSKSNQRQAYPAVENQDRQSQSQSMSRTSSDASNKFGIETQSNFSEHLQHTSGATANTAPVVNDATLVNGDMSHASTALSNLPVPVDATSASHVPLANDAQADNAQNSERLAVPNPHVTADPASSTESVPVADAGEKAPTSSLESDPSTNQDPGVANVTLPKARLPHDKIGMLEDRIKEDPKGDMDAWLSLIDEHKKRMKYDDARSVYERFITVFPTAAEIWVAYAQMENEHQRPDAMEKIFQRTLMQMPYLPMWSLYLDHIRRRHNLTTDTSGQARSTIHQAYDLALRQVGLDKDSGRLWQDYVLFIKSGPGILGGSNWQDQQKMDHLRKTYQRAICIPTQATNTLWKEFDGFEMGLNKMTGRKFVQEQSRNYMTARSSYTELQNITRNLRRTTLPVLPPAMGFDGNTDYMEQLETWKRWIQWEKDDPLVLKQDDIEAYRARILFVYKHALMAMRFWPELYCDASDFCFSNGMDSEGNEFLIQGITANPESCLLAFKRADRLELTTVNEEGDESAIRRGAAVREPFDNVLGTLYDLISRSKAREERDVACIEAEIIEDDKHPNGAGGDDDGPREAGHNDKEKQKAAQIESVKSMHAVQIRLLSRTLSHVWIALMRAMRRIQGKGGVNAAIGGFRGAFGEARKKGRITPDVYVAAALIEFHCYEPDTGRKIFERGLKLFQEDEGFALEYIRHLVANNDHTNARVVFETAVTRLSQKPETAAKAKPLYAFFHDFESRYGELTQIVKLEKRMADLFPDDPALSIFSKRFDDQGFDPTAIRPIISPSQTRPKAITGIEASVPVEQAQPLQAKNSPKRPLPLDESDNEIGRPRKLARGESPLKGAAGRRQDQLKRTQQPHVPPHFDHPMALPPPPLPANVMFLLSIIPRPDTYHATKFKPEELVRLIQKTNIPTNMSQLQQPPGVRGPPAPPPIQHMPPHMQHPTPVQQRPAMPPMPYPQYPGSQYNGQYTPYAR